MNHLDDLQEEMMACLYDHEQEYGRSAASLTVHVNYGDLFEWMNMVIRARQAFGKAHEQGYQEGFADGYAFFPDLGSDSAPGHGKVADE